MNRRKVLVVGGGLALAGIGGAFAARRSMGSMADYNAVVERQRVGLTPNPNAVELIRYATLAASGHNTQPWRFRTSLDQIDIMPDLSRRTPVVDPDDHHLFVSLGCAAENLVLAAQASGRSGALRFDPDNDGSLVFAMGRGTAGSSALFDAIPVRQSTRADYDGKPVTTAELRTLSDAAAIPGVDLVLITDRPQMDRVRDLVIAGNTAEMADPAFVRELKQWLRFSPRHALEAGDGLFSASSGSPALPAWLGPYLFDWTFKAKAENDKYAGHLASSSGIAVFVSQREDREHWILAGRSCQRFALQATALGLKHAFVNQPVEVAPLRPELAALVGMHGRRPDIVMRFGHGPALPFSARRPAKSVIVA